MDFHFTAEQSEFGEAVRRFADEHLKAGARERAHATGYPWDVAKLIAAQGLLGIVIPEADGGQGGSLMDAVIAIESIAASCPRSADVVQAGNFGAIRVLAEYGTPAQKERFLKRLLCEFQGLQWKFADMKMKLDAGLSSVTEAFRRARRTGWCLRTSPRCSSARRSNPSCATTSAHRANLFDMDMKFADVEDLDFVVSHLKGQA